MQSISFTAWKTSYAAAVHAFPLKWPLTAQHLTETVVNYHHLIYGGWISLEMLSQFPRALKIAAHQGLVPYSKHYSDVFMEVAAIYTTWKYKPINLEGQKMDWLTYLLIYVVHHVLYSRRKVDEIERWGLVCISGCCIGKTGRYPHHFSFFLCGQTRCGYTFIL